MVNIVIMAIGVGDDGVENMVKQDIGYGSHLIGMYGVEKNKAYMPVLNVDLSV